LSGRHRDKVKDKKTSRSSPVHTPHPHTPIPPQNPTPRDAISSLPLAGRSVEECAGLGADSHSPPPSPDVVFRPTARSLLPHPAPPPACVSTEVGMHLPPCFLLPLGGRHTFGSISNMEFCFRCCIHLPGGYMHTFRSKVGEWSPPSPQIFIILLNPDNLNFYFIFYLPLPIMFSPLSSPTATFI